MQCPVGAVIVDAGISMRSILQNITACGGDPARVHAIVVTHKHKDHIQSAPALQHRLGCRLIMTEPTFAAALEYNGSALDQSAVDILPENGTITAGGIAIRFIPTPHDADGSVAVRLKYANRRVGVFTDLGHNFKGLDDAIRDLDLVYLESNYDHKMLAEGPYPPWLQSRIAGPGGHISNHSAAKLLRDLPGNRVRQVILSHLSAKNNTPQAALDAFLEIAGARIQRDDIELAVAPRSDPTRLYTVGEPGV